MSKLFSRVCLTADNSSTVEYLCPGMPDTEEQITETDGYCDFLEDTDEDDIAEFEKRGEDFLNSDEVDYLDYNRFVIPTGDVGFSMEKMT